MQKKRFHWLRSYPRTALCCLLFTLFTLLNGFAYRHAWTMTHFAQQGARTKRPEQLSFMKKLEVIFTGVSIPKPIEQEKTPADYQLPFEVHHIAGSGGIELEVWYLPHPLAKGIVLMFHGYAACKAGLLAEAKTFHDLGFATFLVDFHGSGGSSGCNTTIGMLEADEVVLAADYARTRWPNLQQICYGQSMGSAAILRASAVLGYRPAAIIVECPFDRLLTTVGNRFGAMGLPAFPLAHLLVFWGGVQQGFNGFQHNPVEYAARVVCPVLHMQGSDDQRVTREQAQTIFDSLAGAKKLELFNGVKHESYLAIRPEQWRHAVGEFLAKHVKKPQPRDRQY
jgi:alpha-beta hydrolase superfamily lysophospholipase